VSGGAHVLALAAVMLARPEAPPAVDLAPMTVALVPLPPPPVIQPAETPSPEPEPEPAPRAEAQERPVEPPPRRIPVRRTPIPPQVPVEPIPAEPAPYPGDANAEVSESELAGAGTAASAGRGGACNMTRRLQAALREDRRVRAAVAEAYRGRALRVWDGDWVRHAGQEGAGLAQVREAILWEVGFAPEACRREPVRGLVVIALSDAPGGARLVVGAPAWRWSDLLVTGGRPAG
jgi:hypothetical protein